VTAVFNSADRIIRFAMEDAGLLQDGENPSADSFAKYLQRLNDIINYWQTSGIKLWLLGDIAIPLVAGQRIYHLGPTGDVVMTKPMRAIQGYYLDSHNVRRPLVTLSWDEYLRLSQVISSGAINSFFVDKQQLELVVYLWLVPDASAATGSVHLLLQKQVTNLVTINDSMSFPQEWFIALRWALADELATGQPLSIIQRCAGKAAIFKEALENWDVEDTSTRFEPDARSQYYTQKFS